MSLLPNALYEISRTGNMIVEKNVDVPLPTAPPASPRDPLLVRANVFRPKPDGRYPVLLTYSPYGKDIHYSDFHVQSYALVNPRFQTPSACWEAPEPTFWVSQNYVVMRADERGTGKSPGTVNCLTESTVLCNKNVGLLGVSYYASSQWWVAAMRPKGLTAMVPYEGASDVYEECAWHGGILSSGFLGYWWPRQVGSNQYGLSGQVDPAGYDGTHEPHLAPELVANRRDMRVRTLEGRNRDNPIYPADRLDASNIDVPILSVANWGAINSHLGRKRDGIPQSSVALQVSVYHNRSTGHTILRGRRGRDSEVAPGRILKDSDDRGWKQGKVPLVDLCLRRGKPPVDDYNDQRRFFPCRFEKSWPIERTQHTNYHLSASKYMAPSRNDRKATLTYKAVTGQVVFQTSPFTKDVEISGHPHARLSISLSRYNDSNPSDIDIFLALQHLDATGMQIFYTGSAGDKGCIVRGWLRVSHRKLETDSVRSKKLPFVPMHTCAAEDVLSVEQDVVYTVAVELWPKNVDVEKGHLLALIVSGSDIKTSADGIFSHVHPEDRPLSVFEGFNSIHVGGTWNNYLCLPVIPTT